ncbi:MAG: valine--tRNA ligase [bacterium]
MDIPKAYNPKAVEEKISFLWEKNKCFTPKINKAKKPFTIILPPPNANDPLHIGHAMYVVEDIMCRYHRMQQEPTLFLPGTDHAGIETQYVFEKKLKKENKSRFDFDRQTLYQMISRYVDENRGITKEQMKKLGFSLDWTRECFTLDEKILKTVSQTFKKLYRDGLIYRAERIVNYCTRCGTAFSDLEVVYEERQDPLFYLKYGPFVLATTRPETKFGDTAVAVNPKDKRYKNLVGKDFIYESLIGPRKIKVVADEAVNQEFGTGAVKVTPAHDPNDFEIAQRHNLPLIKVIDLNGRMNELTGRFAGLKINEARKKVVEELQQRGDLVRIDESYIHRIGLCYRCKNVIEPMVLPQWFLKIKTLAEPAIRAVKTEKTKIFPLRFKKLYFDWMEKIHDWNISRQNIWGPRIPAWYCLDCNPEIRINFIDKNKNLKSNSYQELKNKYSFAEIESGLQSLTAPVETIFIVDKKDKCPKCKGNHLLQETDTFDTWFSSGQWPLTTLGYPDSRDFKYFYPTSVLDTMWDILFFWVARMMMFGLYLTKKVPFKVIHLHSRVVDQYGQKMSKSKGNGIDPLEMIERYGADSLRIALVFGAAPGSDISVSEDKIRAMRNFSNKLWNINRFILTNLEMAKMKTAPVFSPKTKGLSSQDKKIIKETTQLIKKITGLIDRYRFDLAAQELYHFVWHNFADKYIEYSKPRLDKEPKTTLAVLSHVYLNCLKLLHPFMPFITEKIWQTFPHQEDKLLTVSSWPKIKK